MEDEIKPIVKRKRKAGEALNDGALIKQVAALAALGGNQTSIGKELGINDETAARILAKEETRAIIDDIGDAAVKQAKARLKTQISSLAESVYKALKFQLEKKNSIQAAGLALKVMGMDGESESKAQGQLIVNLPGVSTAPNGETITITPISREDQ